MLADALYIAFGYKIDQASVAQAERGLDTIGSKVKMIAAGAAAILAPAAILAYAKGKLDEARLTADVAAKEARRIGITTEALQELEYAAGKSGVKVEELRAGMTKLGAKVNDAANGNKQMRDVLRELGLDAQHLKDQSIDQQFESIAQAISEVPDAGARARLSMKLLEEMGPKFASMFEGGAAGIRAMREEAQALGLIITDEDARKAEKFNDTLAAISMTGDALTRSFMIDLLPILQEFLDVLQNVQTYGLKGNKVAIRELAQATKELLREMLSWLKTTIKIYHEIGGLTGALKLFAIVLGSVAFAYVALGTAANGAVVANLKVAASAAAAAAPYVLLAASVGLVLLALDDLRGWIEGEDSLIGDVFGEYSEETLQNIQTGLIAIGVVLAVLLGGTLGIFALIALAVAALVVYWDDLGAIAESFFDWLLAKWEDAKQGAEDFGTWLGQWWVKLTDGLSQAWADFVQYVLSKLDEIMGPINRLKDRFGEIGGEFSALFGGDGPAQPTSLVAASATRAATGAGRQITTGDVRVTVDARGMDQDQAQVAVTGGISDAVLRIADDGLGDGV